MYTIYMMNQHNKGWTGDTLYTEREHAAKVLTDQGYTYSKGWYRRAPIGWEGHTRALITPMQVYVPEEETQRLLQEKEAEEQYEREYLEAFNMIRKVRFTWDEMMELLADAGGVLTFSPVGGTTLFSRYGEDRDGHYITTLGLQYYSALDHISEERLAPFKEKLYKIDSFYCKWNDTRIAHYLKGRTLPLTKNQ